MIWIALWGCTGDKDNEVTGPPPVQWHLETLALPKGPDDPVIMYVTGGEELESPGHPDVRDASGAQVPMVPLYSGARLDGYVAEGGFLAGEYEVVGSVEHETIESASFEVTPYGAAALDPNGLVGRAWRVAEAKALPIVLDDLVWDQLGDTELIVTIDAITEEGVEFRVLVRGDESDCVGFRDRASLDESGRRLVWTEDEATLTLPAAEGTLPLPLHDLSVELAWLDGNEGQGWGSGRATGDLANLDEIVGLDNSVCDTSSSFGLDCEPCPGGSEPSCMPAALVAGLLEEVPYVPVSSEMAVCGIDRIAVEDIEIELPPLSCDFESDMDLDLDLDCGCQVVSSRAGLPLMLAALLVARRRRSS